MAIKGKTLINVNDIIGERSGKLKVISYAGYIYSITKGGDRMRHYYLCECDCGKMHVIERGPLKNKIVRSCGCSRRQTWQ